MLKIVFGLAISLVIAEGLEINATRAFLYVNPDPKQNFFFDVKYTEQQGMGDYDHKDYKLNWRQQLTDANSHEMRILFTIDYGTNRKTVTKRINACKTYPKGSMEDIAKHFFYEALIAPFSYKACPVGQKTTTVSGSIDFHQRLADGIECKIPMKLVLYIWSPLHAIGSDGVESSQQLLLVTIYTGEFLDCDR